MMRGFQQQMTSWTVGHIKKRKG